MEWKRLACHSQRVDTILWKLMIWQNFKQCLILQFWNLIEKWWHCVFSSGSKTGMSQPLDREQRPSGVPQAHGRLSEFEMGECRDGRLSQLSRTGGSESQRSAETASSKKPVRQSTKLRRPATSPGTRAQSALDRVRNQEQMAQMQQMQAQMQEMFMQMQNVAMVAQEAAGSEDKMVKPRAKSASGQNKTKSKPKLGALTNPQADFPTLSNVFSDDVTYNIAKSLLSQTVTFKWKMVLLLCRIKAAVEHEGKKRWKRNPRWIMHMHGRHLASMWGHLGSARQLCFNPRVYPLALGMPVEVEIDEEHPAPQGAQRRSPSTRRRWRLNCWTRMHRQYRSKHDVLKIELTSYVAVILPFISLMLRKEKVLKMLFMVTLMSRRSHWIAGRDEAFRLGCARRWEHTKECMTSCRWSTSDGLF